MSKLINSISITVGTLGIFFGFFFLSNDPFLSLRIITITTVGIVGVLSFIRHFVFHKEDAKRLGWETEKPDWMFEVGFANLSFGFMGITSVFFGWGVETLSLVLLGYAVYLFQAALLHGYRYFTDETKLASRLWRSCLLTFFYVSMMTFFALQVHLN
ncbi:MAG: DUF6790 family protein [Melioribacteraceae bacterium]